MLPVAANAASAASASAVAAAAASSKLAGGCARCGASVGAGIIMPVWGSGGGAPLSAMPLPTRPGSMRDPEKDSEVRRPAPSMRAPRAITDGRASLDGLPSPVCNRSRLALQNAPGS